MQSQIFIHTALYCTYDTEKGRSADKVWAGFLVREQDPSNAYVTGHLLVIYGARGSNLVVNRKVYGVTRATAEFHKLTAKKKAKGYKEVWWRDPQFGIVDSMKLKGYGNLVQQYIEQDDVATAQQVVASTQEAEGIESLSFIPSLYTPQVVAPVPPAPSKGSHAVDAYGDPIVKEPAKKKPVFIRGGFQFLELD